MVAGAFFAFHCSAPAGLLVSSHSYLEEIIEKMIAPLRGRLAPGYFGTSADCVSAEALAILALPTETLILDQRALGLRAEERRVARAVGLAESMAAGDQRHGLFVIHGHARERLADVAGRCDEIGFAVGPFRVDVNEPHLDRAQRLLQFAFAAVAFVAQPRSFRTPVKLFGLPGIHPAAAEAERLEPHRLEGHVARENHQIGPGNFPPVFLLDRPEQAPRLVEVHVIRPAIQRSEPLLPAASAAAAIGDPVGACAVPRHANHQAAIVAEIGRPPILRVGHQGVQVLDYGIQVQALELLGVVEILAHGVGLRRMLIENLKVQLVGPPVTITACRTLHAQPGTWIPLALPLRYSVLSPCVHLSSNESKIVMNFPLIVDFRPVIAAGLACSRAIHSWARHILSRGSFCLLLRAEPWRTPIIIYLSKSPIGSPIGSPGPRLVPELCAFYLALHGFRE